MGVKLRPRAKPAKATEKLRAAFAENAMRALGRPPPRPQKPRKP